MTEDKQKKSPQTEIKGYAATQGKRVRDEGLQDTAEDYNAKDDVPAGNEPD